MMSHLITCILFTAGGAVISGLFVDLKWKEAAKKMFERISSLEDGLSFKQAEINNLSSKLIASSSKVGMLESTLIQKDMEINALTKKHDAFKVAISTPLTATTATPTTAEPVATKKRGPYKKKRYGRPASNNDSSKKTE